MVGHDPIKTAEELIGAFSASDWEQFKTMLADDITYAEAGTGRRVHGVAAWQHTWSWPRDGNKHSLMHSGPSTTQSQPALPSLRQLPGQAPMPDRSSGLEVPCPSPVNR
jgi:hypothetical protein